MSFIKLFFFYKLYIFGVVWKLFWFSFPNLINYLNTSFCSILTDLDNFFVYVNFFDLNSCIIPFLKSFSFLSWINEISFIYNFLLIKRIVVLVYFKISYLIRFSLWISSRTFSNQNLKLIFKYLVTWLKSVYILYWKLLKLLSPYNIQFSPQ